MRLTDATFVAIDMDFTLVSYRADALVPLVRGLCLRYLVQEEGYCRELLEVEPLFPCERPGYCVDLRLGIVFQLDGEHRPRRAYRGTTALSDEEVEALYQGDVEFWEWDVVEPHYFVPPPLPPHSTQDSTHIGGGGSADAAHSEEKPHQRVDRLVEEHRESRFQMFWTYFDCCLPGVFAHLAAQGEQSEKAFHRYLLSLKRSIFAMYTSFEDSPFFKTLREETSRFVHKAPEEKQALKRLLDHGVKLVLITNSLPEFTNLLMRFAYGEDWESMFSMVVVRARKPVFWTGENPFFALNVHEVSRWHDLVETQVEVPCLDGGRQYYMRGNNVGLMSALQEFLDTTQPDSALSPWKLLYVGDHVQSDIAVPKKYCNHMTLCVATQVAGSIAENPLTDLLDFSSLSTSSMMIPQLTREYSDLIVPSLRSLLDFDVDHDFASNLEPLTFAKEGV